MVAHGVDANAMQFLKKATVELLASRPSDHDAQPTWRTARHGYQKLYFNPSPGAPFNSLADFNSVVQLKSFDVADAPLRGFPIKSIETTSIFFVSKRDAFGCIHATPLTWPHLSLVTDLDRTEALFNHYM